MFSDEPVRTPADLPRDACYRHAIFSVPPGDSPFWYIHWGAFTCRNSLVFASFARRILQRFDLLDTPPPTKPTILWVSRRDSGTRIIPYEDEVRAWLQPHVDAGRLELNIVSLQADLPSFRDQIAIARRSNVMVAPNGSGLMHAIYMAEEAIVMEVQWLGGAPEQFRNVAKAAGKLHFAVRSAGPEYNYNTGKKVEYINVTLDALKDGIRAALVSSAHLTC
ncbi:hypothetical protein HK405_009312 [Cladochytrium tenue]|nr:hypothetical protein HK405_009312 [Cladochytrium tenue]